MITRNEVRQKISGLLEVDSASVKDDAGLFELASSSFRIVELVIELQEAFDVRFHQADMNEIDSVGDLIDLTVTRHNGRSGC